MAFSKKYGDITKCSADAIVIPANPNPIIGYGVDREIYHLAGRNRLLKERREIGEIEIGKVGITLAYDYPADYIIHAVSPGWIDGKCNEAELLKSCYINALDSAFERNCKSIVFPLLSTGILHFPRETALEIAEETCLEYSEKHSEIEITLVLYDSYEPQQTFGDLDSFIQENNYANFNIEAYRRLEKEVQNLPSNREEWEILRIMRLQMERRKADLSELSKHSQSHSSSEEKMSFHLTYSVPFGSLDDYIKNAPRVQSLDEQLKKYKAEKKFSSFQELCEKAGMEEYTLSKLRRGTKKNISRDELWSLSIGLKLDYDETKEFFSHNGVDIRGNYNFSYDDMCRELIFEYHIKTRDCDIDRVNYNLMDRNLKPLGSYFREERKKNNE